MPLSNANTPPPALPTTPAALSPSEEITRLLVLRTRIETHLQQLRERIDDALNILKGIPEPPKPLKPFPNRIAALAHYLQETGRPLHVSDVPGVLREMGMPSRSEDPQTNWVYEARELFQVKEGVVTLLEATSKSVAQASTNPNKEGGI